MLHRVESCFILLTNFQPLLGVFYGFVPHQGFASRLVAAYFAFTCNLFIIKLSFMIRREIR